MDIKKPNKDLSRPRSEVWFHLECPMGEIFDNQPSDEFTDYVEKSMMERKGELPRKFDLDVLKRLVACWSMMHESKIRTYVCKLTGASHHELEGWSKGDFVAELLGRYFEGKPY